MQTGLLPDSVVNGLSRLTGDFETSATLPPACYADPAVLAAENHQIFGRGWVGVGRSDRWSGRGAYSAIDIGGVPVVVIRNADDSLTALSNTCSHRSTQLLTDEGSCTSIRCPFHFWTYGLDGALLGAPSMHKTVDFDKSDHSLHEFHLEERHGFAFVSLEDQPPTIDEWLGDFDDLHSPWKSAILSPHGDENSW